MTPRPRATRFARLCSAWINASFAAPCLGARLLLLQSRSRRAHAAWGSRACDLIFEPDSRARAKACALGALACALIALAPLPSFLRPPSPSAAAAQALARAAQSPLPAELGSYENHALFDGADDPIEGDPRDSDPILLFFSTCSGFFSLAAASLHLQRARGSLGPWRIESLSAKLSAADARLALAHAQRSRSDRRRRRIQKSMAPRGAHPPPSPPPP